MRCYGRWCSETRPPGHQRQKRWRGWAAWKRRRQALQVLLQVLLQVPAKALLLTLTLTLALTLALALAPLVKQTTPALTSDRAVMRTC